MGSYKRVYIGIYLEIPYKKTIKKEIIYVHPQTGKTQKYRFDGTTGLENVEKTVETVHYIRPVSYITDNDDLGEDDFFTPAYNNCEDNTEIFLLNGNTKYSKDIEDLKNVNLTNLHIVSLIEDFKEEYEKYLDYYLEKFDKVEVKYGVIIYYAS